MKQPRDMVVLVVDDNAMVLRVTARQLRSEFRTVIEASGVKSALEALRTNKVDVVLSDWDMPDGGGGAIMDASNVPVVIYSGGVGWFSKLDGEKIALAAVVMDKPSNTRDLINALCNAMARKVRSA